MWFYFDFELPTEQRVADLFLDRNWQLSPGERHCIEVLRQSTMRLYEVEDLSPGISVTLKEVLTSIRSLGSILWIVSNCLVFKTEFLALRR